MHLKPMHTFTIWPAKRSLVPARAAKLKPNLSDQNNVLNFEVLSRQRGVRRHKDQKLNFLAHMFSSYAKMLKLARTEKKCR